MEPQLSTLLSVLFHAGIALAYFGIGLYLVPRTDFGLGARTQATRWMGVAFFVTCAVTHVYLAGVELDMHTPHEFMLANHGIQAGAGLGFLLLSWKYLDLHVTAPPLRTPKELSHYESYWKLARDIILFFTGISGILHQVTIPPAERDFAMLGLFSAMIGLSGWFRGMDLIRIQRRAAENDK